MAYRNKVMTVYVLGLMMSVIDGTMVNVALPTLAHEFGVPTTDIEWIAIGYLLSFAAVIPAAVRAVVSSRRSDRRCSTAPSRWPNAPRRRSACSA